MSEAATDPHRLPQRVRPSRYAIRLEPDLAAGRFAGEVEIDLTVEESAREIVLNAADLALQGVRIQDRRGRVLEGSARLDGETERAHLTFPEELAAGAWRLSLGFTGRLGDQLRGFYRSTFREADGGEGVLAVTQFEATDARRAFPCWDEPAFKAIFEITLVVPEGMAAISNGRLLREEPLPGTGKKAVAFAPTIPLSTYLVACVVGHLAATPARMAGETPIRVWCVPGKEGLAEFALEVAAFSLGFFEEYYGIPYPGEKLDLIAIPDFAFGAMENLGAITFRETALLVDAAAASHAERVRVADVVAHEIAHMWFGDLVTMAWWNGLWLNEAFATFMEVQAVDAWRPAWRRWEAFGVSRAAALAVDGLLASRPVEFPVAAPRDAEAMFDVLTYEKGGAVLRMLERYLGPEVFRAGIRRYLAAHRFGTAETGDLWRALGEASGRPISAILEGWIFREGYPVVEADLEDDRRTLVLRQRRFTYLEPAEPSGPVWQIPLTLRVKAEGVVRSLRHLLAAPVERIPLPGPADWAVVNDGGHGFYRVGYAPALAEPVARGGGAILGSVERFNLLGDTWALTLAGAVPVGEYLALTAAFRGETDRHVWSVLLSSLAFLQRVIRPEEGPGLAALVRDRLAPAAARLGWSPRPEEDALTRQLRGELLRCLGTLGEEARIQATARERVARLGQDPAGVDPDVAPAVVGILAHTGGEAEYEAFLARVRDARTPQEEQRYLFGLAGFREPTLVARTLEAALGPRVRAQDAPFLLRALLLGVHSREAAWEFVQGHWDALGEKFPPLTGLRRMCEGLAALATPELEAEVLAFLAAREVRLGGRGLEQSLEQLRIAVRFREREGAALAALLRGGA